MTKITSNDEGWLWYAGSNRNGVTGSVARLPEEPSTISCIALRPSSRLVFPDAFAPYNAADLRSRMGCPPSPRVCTKVLESPYFLSRPATRLRRASSLIDLKLLTANSISMSATACQAERRRASLPMVEYCPAWKHRSTARIRRDRRYENRQDAMRSYPTVPVPAIASEDKGRYSTSAPPTGRRPWSPAGWAVPGSPTNFVLLRRLCTGVSGARRWG